MREDSSFQFRTWFITGCSSGLGRALAVAALQAGDRVVATARRPDSLAGLVAQAPERCLAHALDVRDPAEVQAAVAESIARFRRLDVVVNNASHGLIGAVEECGDSEARRCFETNFFGAVNVIRSVLPQLREQRSGHMVNVSAAAAVANYAGFGFYGAAKAALEALSESLRSETAPLGLKVTLVEPGPFRTDFISRSLEPASGRIADYDRTSGKFAAVLKSIDGRQPGDPARAAAAIVEMVRAGRAPFRLPLGGYMVKKLRDRAAELARVAADGEALAVAADFPAAG